MSAFTPVNTFQGAFIFETQKWLHISTIIAQEKRYSSLNTQWPFVTIAGHDISRQWESANELSLFLGYSFSAQEYTFGGKLIFVLSLIIVYSLLIWISAGLISACFFIFYKAFTYCTICTTSVLFLVTSYSSDKFLHKEKSRLSSYFPTVIVSSRRLPFVNKMYYKFSGFTQRLTGVVSSSAYSPQVCARDSVSKRLI